MIKIIKEYVKVLIACGALIAIIMCPALISLTFYYLSKYLTEIGVFSGYPQDIFSFFSGSIVSSSIMFFFLIFLIQSKKLKMETEDNAENTEQEN